MRVSSRLFFAAAGCSAMLSGMAWAAPLSRFAQQPSGPGNGTLDTRAAFAEGFDVVPPPGWAINNQSDNPTAALTTWFQGNPAVFSAHSGATTSYAGANFNNTGNNVGTISDWLISPVLSLSNGDVIRFFTRTVDVPSFPDRLQLRLSPTGGNNPGTGSSSTGDFSTLLVDVNPTLTTTGYPNAWTQFTATVSGNFPTSRLAFRYFVTGGGPGGANSDYIGVDTFTVSSVPEPATLGGVAIAGVSLLARRRRA